MGRPQGRFSEAKHLRMLLEIGPANRDHEVAIRCVITVLVPLLVLLAIGRLDLVVFASFGAFPAIYGRNLLHGPRLQMQVRAAILMFATLMAATLMARWLDGMEGEAWITVAGVAVVAAVSAMVAQYWQLRPGGSIFNVFSFGAVISVPSQPPLFDAAITSAIVIVWALLIGMSSRLLGRKYWHRIEWPREPVLRGRPHATFLRDGAMNFIAAGVAGVVALQLATPLSLEHTYWAQLAAVVPVAGQSTTHGVNRGAQRIIGTFIGLWSTALVLWWAPPLWVLVLLIAALQGLTELFVVRSYLFGQVFVTPLALLSVALATVGSGGQLERTGLVYDRFVETVIGAAAGILVLLVPWAVRRFRKK